ncbi:homoserine O-acetyltransferase MetX [Lihuaxuella thermophila]|uniref:Homoserine O-acetyltransferase n=1 Tax=Lihuaxuella thermophila TaxID=1173111 RepID=A0A1H8CY79_9BACL|nr:homoserine O-acetyltransferase [Lihuaxuella thermophila]SEM99996.1 homoserine O-acetyltransferase [Lihuaxuella thermophila]
MLTRLQREARLVNIGEFRLESGERLPEVNIAVEIAGTISPGKNNVILLCHALTGDTRAVGDSTGPGWWDGMIGEDGFIDLHRFAVVTMNVLGGCGGSTGPSSNNPETGRPYGSRFPKVTIRDMVRAQQRCLHKLGINRVEAVIGGSMGGMLALEWAILFPKQVKKCIPIATGATLSSLSIAYNEIGRQAILTDPMWQGGDYYPGPGPVNGLAIARMIGMVTYRTEKLFEERFRMKRADNPVTLGVASYLHYQGKKLVNRFDANTYLLLLHAMDTHDIGRGRGGVERAIARIEAEMLTIGITEDLYFPVRQQRELHEVCLKNNKKSTYLEFGSPYGHDAFLIEFDKFGYQVREFLES